MKKEIKWKKLTRKESLKELPEIIHTLRNTYHFGYSYNQYGSQNIIKLIESKEDCKGLIYEVSNGWSNYWIIFRKNDVVVYYTPRTEFTSASSSSALSQYNLLRKKIHKALKIEEEK